MAKQTRRQQAIVERVMHEFKEGALETSAGEQVRNPKQAIAIGLSEAGASNQQSPKQNARRLARTTAAERGSDAGSDQPSKVALYAEAKARRIPGRSRMN